MGWINSDDYLTKNCFLDLQIIDKFPDIGFVTACRSVKLANEEIIYSSQEVSTRSILWTS